MGSKEDRHAAASARTTVNIWDDLHRKREIVKMITQ